MPGKRYRYQLGKHRVRITGHNISAGTVYVETTDGTTTCVQLEKLQPIAQKSTKPKPAVRSARVGGKAKKARASARPPKNAGRKPRALRSTRPGGNHARR